MNKLKLLDLSNINEKIYNYLKQNIILSNFPPGSRLNIRQLCEELSVSPTPIKDALFRLSGEGLIEISSRSGTYVRSITERDIHEMLQVRLYLEEAVASEIVGKITDDQLKCMESIYAESLLLNREEYGPENYKECMEADARFHRCMFVFTGNKFLLKMYDTLNTHMQTVRFLIIHRAHGKLPTTDDDHQRILKACIERNIEQAKQAIKRHLGNAGAAWKKIGEGAGEQSRQAGMNG